MWQYEKPDNLVQWWEESAERYPEKTLFLCHDGQGGLDHVSYAQIDKRIRNTRAGLAALGIGPGDAVGIIAPNCPAWAVLAYAAYGRQARFVPMYEKELVQTWKYICRDSAIKVLAVSSPEILEQVKDFSREIDTLENIILIDGEGENTLSALEEKGAAAAVEPLIPGSNEVAVLIYTSGTTAEPKGVLLTHGNVTYCSLAGIHLFPQINTDSVGLSMLPWAHSYAYSAELNTWIRCGAALGFMQDVTTLAEDLRLVKPTYLISVPRLFNKIYDGIHLKMEEAGGLKKKLFYAACTAAQKQRELTAANLPVSAGLRLKASLLDKVVFSKLREAMGGRVTGALTASATMNKEIAGFFFDIGIPTYDCYGLTETSPAVTMNSPEACRLGSVGKPLEGQKVVIDQTAKGEEAEQIEQGDDGEIIVYGPNVMQGYHNKPGETARVMTADGGFRTGDRGRLDEDGYLWITGRIKEQYKLTNGKYVFPATLEEEIKLIPGVANAMVYGDGRPYNICLIVPDFAETARWSVAREDAENPDALIQKEEFRSLLEKKIRDRLANTFGGYEIPEKYIFLTEDFSVENKMLTQTMKLKRREVLDRFAAQVEELYSS